MNTLKAIITICCFGFIYFSVNGQSSDLTETSLSFSPAVPGPMSAVYSLNGSRLFRNFSTGIFSPDTVRVGNTFGFSFLTGSRLSINTAAVIPSDIALYNLQNIQYRSDGTNLAQEIWTIGRNPKVNDPPKGFFEITRSKIFPGGGAVLNPVMTIDTNLNVILGSHPDTPMERLEVVGNARFTNIGNTQSASDLRVTSNGTLTLNTSDLRLKDNVSTIKDALSKVLKLRGVSFNWINDSSIGPQHGLIAQEVMEVVPELVFKNGEYYGVDYSELVGLFVEAIKEQQTIIENQQKEIDKLQNLEARLESIEQKMNR